MKKRGFTSGVVYLAADALRSMRANAASCALTAVTLGFSLAIFFLFLFIFINLESAVNKWGDKTHIVVYIKDTALKDGVERLRDSARFIPGVKTVEYVSKEKALEELKAELKGHEEIIAGVDVNPLPASFDIRVSPAYTDAQGVASVVGTLKAMSWASDVQYSREWVEKFSAFLRFIELAATAVGVFIAAATVFIISNTIRLTVWARRDEIEVMRLVGATDAYIKIPFFIEGVIQGFIGGVFALGVLTAGRYILLGRMPGYLDFALSLPLDFPELLAALAASGMLMGATASIISTTRFLGN
ncbi:MAG: ABC transporter permease [Deltaproteobacteria bacterium]|nr:ABC transporter permease [Deltaproteobacteria bacterium]